MLNGLPSTHEKVVDIGDVLWLGRVGQTPNSDHPLV